ncbi:MAG: Coenzyme F420 hydrogenase/dehydrogenase, beta subunit C-terminal domain [Pseudomonadota bacterium]
MTRAPATIDAVVACQLCTGCGACAGAFPDAIRMVEDPVHGRRPVVVDPAATARTDAMAVCAGLGAPLPAPRDETEADWGPVRAVWEGWARDPEIRHRGSSGGAVTALALFALASGKARGIAHVTAREDDARLNRATISTDRAGLLAGVGSRYAQASPAELFPAIRSAPGTTAMIGKPCDIASVVKARQADPDLAAKLGPTIAIFCAGAPNLNATEDLLDRLGVPAGARVTALRYRGTGWPGLMQATWREADGTERDSLAIPYAEGWGKILQSGRRWRCRICDDHTGAFADISVGDPWHKPPQGDTDPGRSLIVARTSAGQQFVEQAIAAGVLAAEVRPRDTIARAQPNLRATNAAVWGRRAAMRLTGLPVPQGRSIARFALWWRALGPMAKAQSLAGTLRRILRARLWRPIAIDPQGLKQGPKQGPNR